MFVGYLVASAHACIGGCTCACIGGDVSVCDVCLLVCWLVWLTPLLLMLWHVYCCLIGDLCFVASSGSLVVSDKLILWLLGLLLDSSCVHNFVHRSLVHDSN